MALLVRKLNLLIAECEARLSLKSLAGYLRIREEGKLEGLKLAKELIQLG